MLPEIIYGVIQMPVRQIRILLMYETVEADDRLRELYELSRLYDLYGALLSDHNRVIYEDYVLNNLSLGEISQEMEISRQGVRDVVVRSSKKLREYEERLGLFAKIESVEKGLDELENMIAIGPFDQTRATEIIHEARNIFEI